MWGHKQPTPKTGTGHPHHTHGAQPRKPLVIACTDGSTYKGRNSGAGFVFLHDQYIAHETALTGASWRISVEDNFVAEMAAINRAIRSVPLNVDITIHTDSKSCIQAIQKFKKQGPNYIGLECSARTHLRAICRAKHARETLGRSKTTIKHVRSHTGARTKPAVGNAAADRYAKKAVQEDMENEDINLAQNDLPYLLHHVTYRPATPAEEHSTMTPEDQPTDQDNLVKIETPVHGAMKRFIQKILLAKRDSEWASKERPTHGQNMRENPKTTHRVINHMWKEGMTSDKIRFLIQSLTQSHPSTLDHTGRWVPEMCHACGLEPLTQIHLMECTGCAHITNKAEEDISEALTLTDNPPQDGLRKVTLRTPSTDIIQQATKLATDICPSGTTLFPHTSPPNSPHQDTNIKIHISTLVNMFAMKEMATRQAFWWEDERQKMADTEDSYTQPEQELPRENTFPTNWTDKFRPGLWIACTNDWEGHRGIVIGQILNISKNSTSPNENPPHILPPTTESIIINWLEPIEATTPEGQWKKLPDWTLTITDPIHILGTVEWNRNTGTTWGPLGPQWNRIRERHEGGNGSIEDDITAKILSTKETRHGGNGSLGYRYKRMHTTFQPLKFHLNGTQGVHMNNQNSYPIGTVITSFGSLGKFTYQNPEKYTDGKTLTLFTETRPNNSYHRSYILRPMPTPTEGYGIAQLMRVVSHGHANTELVKDLAGPGTGFHAVATKILTKGDELTLCPDPLIGCQVLPPANPPTPNQDTHTPDTNTPKKTRPRPLESDPQYKHTQTKTTKPADRIKTTNNTHPNNGTEPGMTDHPRKYTKHSTNREDQTSPTQHKTPPEPPPSHTSYPPGDFLRDGVMPDTSKLIDVNPKMNIDDQNFYRHLHTLGHVVREQKTDGNCLFRCISTAMHGHPNNHLYYREHTITTLTGPLWERMQPFIDPEATNMEKAKQKYRTSMQYNPICPPWGGSVETLAMSHITGRPITVHMHLQTPHTHRPDDLTITSNTQPIHISYHRKQHYNLLAWNTITPLHNTTTTHENIPIQWWSHQDMDTAINNSIKTRRQERTYWKTRTTNPKEHTPKTMESDTLTQTIPNNNTPPLNKNYTSVHSISLHSTGNTPDKPLLVNDASPDLHNSPDPAEGNAPTTQRHIEQRLSSDDLVNIWEAILPRQHIWVGPIDKLADHITSILHKRVHTTQTTQGIVNTQKDGEKGSHWLRWIYDHTKGHLHIDDPYGLDTSLGNESTNARNWMHNHRTWTNTSLSHTGQQSSQNFWQCGQRAIYWAFRNTITPPGQDELMRPHHMLKDWPTLIHKILQCTDTQEESHNHRERLDWETKPLFDNFLMTITNKNVQGAITRTIEQSINPMTREARTRSKRNREPLPTQQQHVQPPPKSKRLHTHPHTHTRSNHINLNLTHNTNKNLQPEKNHTHPTPHPHIKKRKVPMEPTWIQTHLDHTMEITTSNKRTTYTTHQKQDVTTDTINTHAHHNLTYPSPSPPVPPNPPISIPTTPHTPTPRPDPTTTMSTTNVHLNTPEHRDDSPQNNNHQPTSLKRRNDRSLPQPPVRSNKRNNQRGQQSKKRSPPKDTPSFITDTIERALQTKRSEHCFWLWPLGQTIIETHLQTYSTINTSALHLEPGDQWLSNEDKDMELGAWGGTATNFMMNRYTLVNLSSRENCRHMTMAAMEAVKISPKPTRIVIIARKWDDIQHLMETHTHKGTDAYCLAEITPQSDELKHQLPATPKQLAPSLDPLLIYIIENHRTSNYSEENLKKALLREERQVTPIYHGKPAGRIWKGTPIESTKRESVAYCPATFWLRNYPQRIPLPGTNPPTRRGRSTTILGIMGTLPPGPENFFKQGGFSPLDRIQPETLQKVKAILRRMAWELYLTRKKWSG
jgi:ribonuclease HI